MKLLFKESFLKRLENQIEFTSLDSPSRARKFKNELIIEIQKISKNPYQFRKSIYFEDEKIIDLIFKGYAIVYIININHI